MLVLLIDVPLFVPDRRMRDEKYTLERGTRIHVVNQNKRHGAVKVKVVAGKYEGLQGNIPATFCASDTMRVVR